MTAQDHPSDTALLAFAAGTLDQPGRVEIAAHVSSCVRCRAFVRAMEHVGGAVLDGLPPTPMAGGSLAGVLARLPSVPSGSAAVPSSAAISRPPGGMARRSFSAWRRIATYRQPRRAFATAAVVVLVAGLSYLAAEYTFRDVDDYPASTATTGTIAIGSSTAGNIERAGDADWFRVLLTDGTTYRFELSGSDTAQGTLQFPVLRLLDSTGRALHSDAGSVNGPLPGWTSVLSYSAPSTATYYLSCEAVGNDRGTYRIHAIELPARQNNR